MFESTPTAVLFPGQGSQQPRMRADSYAAEHLTAAAAAEEGVIDEVVAPPATRGRLIGALRPLQNPERPVRPARNMQL